MYITCTAFGYSADESGHYHYMVGEGDFEQKVEVFINFCESLPKLRTRPGLNILEES